MPSLLFKDQFHKMVELTVAAREAYKTMLENVHQELAGEAGPQPPAGRPAPGPGCAAEDGPQAVPKTEEPHYSECGALVWAVCPSSPHGLGLKSKCLEERHSQSWPWSERLSDLGICRDLSVSVSNTPLVRQPQTEGGCKNSYVLGGRLTRSAGAQV